MTLAFTICVRVWVNKILFTYSIKKMLYRLSFRHICNIYNVSRCYISLNVRYDIYDIKEPRFLISLETKLIRSPEVNIIVGNILKAMTLLQLTFFRIPQFIINETQYSSNNSVKEIKPQYKRLTFKLKAEFKRQQYEFSKRFKYEI